MTKSPLKQTISSAIATGVICLFIGAIVGLIASSGLQIDNTLTVDGIFGVLGTMLAVLAATYLLPLKIQPLLNKQTGILTVAHEDIKSLLYLIIEVIATCEQLNMQKLKVTEANRKLILARHKQIHQLAGTLKDQSAHIDALSHFDRDVFQPLNDSHNDFADNVTAGRKLTDALFLDIRGKLDPIVTKLRDTRYKLN